MEHLVEREVSMKTMIAMSMSIPPWGLLVWASTTAGLVGLSVQIAGLVFMGYLVCTRKFFVE